MDQRFVGCCKFGVYNQMECAFWMLANFVWTRKSDFGCPALPVNTEDFGWLRQHTDTLSHISELVGSLTKQSRAGKTHTSEVGWGRKQLVALIKYTFLRAQKSEPDQQWT